MKRYYIFIAALFVLTILAVVTNYIVQRAPAHDLAVSADLTNIASAVENYSYDHEVLPAGLDDLALSDARLKGRLAEYSYRVRGASTYELCATFQADRTKSSSNYTPPGHANTFTHHKGQQCFNYESEHLKSNSRSNTILD